MKRFSVFLAGVTLAAACTGCAGTAESISSGAAVESAAASASSSVASSSEEATPPPLESLAPVQTGLMEGQILAGSEGDIHYSVFIPSEYDGVQKFPLMMVAPGYDGMWFGEGRSRTPSEWNGFMAWTKLDTPMIVVCAQLTDWGPKSARQAIELTEYFTQHYAVDQSRIYAAGYSAGGETMSQAVSMRPDLFAAYLHGASQWDGSYEPIAENGVAVYIYMADGDEYYGSDKARSAYNGLLTAYQNAGWTQDDIEKVLRLEIPDNAFFNEKGIYNYHGGANVLFDDAENLNWVISHRKES